MRPTFQTARSEPDDADFDGEEGEEEELDAAEHPARLARMDSRVIEGEEPEEAPSDPISPRRATPLKARRCLPPPTYPSVL